MTLVFNELSAANPALTRNEAMEWMNHLVKAIASLVGDRAAKLIHVDSFDLFGMTLSVGYSFGAWLQDRTVDRDQRLFFQRISTKMTFDRDISESVKDRFLLSEFRRQGRDASGLGLSYLLGTVAVSLRSEACWMKIRILLQYSWLELDESQHSMEIVALNIADHAQVKTVADELLTRAQSELSAAPRSLVDRFRECFPHVYFGLDVETQLSLLPGDMLEPIIAKLIVLDGSVRDWRRAKTALPSLPKVHGESAPTMQRYGDRRRFRRPDGEMATYEPHAMVGNRYRIHFRVDQPRRTLEIGYIGKHLPTARVPK